MTRAETDWSPIRMTEGPRRPFLVIIRTGKKSIHTTWAHDLEDGGDRNWDLLLSHYADSEPACPDAEMIVRQGSFKYPACHRLFQDIGWLQDYRAVWLCDDDIMTSWRNINRMFELFEHYDLQLAQPALTADSYFSHRITLQQPDYMMRFTNYVEIMAPVFAMPALQLCLPSFGDAVTGWGIDWAWPALLGKPWNKVAVLDATPVRHTRPVLQGDIYKNAGDAQGASALEEHLANLKKYGVAADPIIYGSLNSEPQAFTSEPPSFGLRRPLTNADMQQMDKIAVELGRSGGAGYSEAPEYKSLLDDWHSDYDAAALSCPILPLQAQDYVMQFGLRLRLEPQTPDAVEILLIGAQRKQARLLIDAIPVDNERFYLKMHVVDTLTRQSFMVTLPELAYGQTHHLETRLVARLGYIKVMYDGQVVECSLIPHWQWDAVDHVWVGSKRLRGVLEVGWISPMVLDDASKTENHA